MANTATSPENRLREVLDRIESFNPCDPNAYESLQAIDVKDFRHLATLFRRAARSIRNIELRSQALAVPHPNDMDGVYDAHAEICALAPEIRDELDNIVEDDSEDPTALRVFISYSTADKKIAGRAKEYLTRFGIDAFLAHDDINVSDEWKDRIISELRLSNIFICILSKDFKASDWTSQEIGFAYYRAASLFIPVSIDGTTPYGFISHIQGKPIPKSGDVFELLVEPIAKRYPRLMLPLLIKRVVESQSFESANVSMKVLEPYFDNFTDTDINSLAEGAAENSQVWSAWKCRDQMLPAFIKMHKARIHPDILKRLEYQVKNDMRYHEPNDDDDII